MSKRIYVPREMCDLLEQVAKERGKKPRNLICEIVVKYIKEREGK